MINTSPASPLAASPAAVSSADLYLRVRSKEGRIYSDEIVSRLPDFPADHPLKSEWLVRADSSARLHAYVGALPRPLRVLDLGCGNGWLSHALGEVGGVNVWALDRPGPELAQAARVFAEGNMAFLGGDIDFAPFTLRAFDLIVLASVIQYFADLPTLIRRLSALLGPSGEIHLLDSPLYPDDELAAARQRSAAYYSALGFPEMASSYFHHTHSELIQFHPDYLYDPRRLGSSLRKPFGRAGSPFPWIRIRLAP